MKPLNKKQILPLVKKALREDIASGDITTLSFIPRRTRVKGFIMVEEKGILCGMDIAGWVFKELDKSVKFRKLKKDGALVRRHTKVAEFEGKAFYLLQGERTALNFLGYLSGIATSAWKWRKKLPPNIKILDTRKTRPTLRILEKYATETGGIKNHRLDLSSGILIKDNHYFVIKHTTGDLEILRRQILRARKRYKKEVIMEAHSIREFLKFIGLPVDIIILDNFSMKNIRKCINLRNRRRPSLKLEASGGIKEHNVSWFKNCAVERVSAGRIIHSARFLTLSLEIEKVM